MKHTKPFLMRFLILVLVFLVACGGNSGSNDNANTTENESGNNAAANTENTANEAAEENTTNDAAAEEPTEEPAAEPASDRIVVRWFVGLGTGQNDEQVAAQEAVVEAFNASQDEIELRMEIVQNDVAYDTLATLIASGDAPDIIGPVGVKGSNAFTGKWLDLQPLVDASGYDLAQFPEGAVNFYRVEGEGLIGLPFGVFPSFVYYNRALFDEAGLDYPPHEYGAPYADGDEWTYEKLEELAMLLTVDANGNDAASADFDPESIVQFGYINQWTDGRGAPTPFGAGNFVDADGNAYVPDHWREAFNWLHTGIWEKHFIPTQAYQDSELLSTPNAFASGNVAMAVTHLWFTCCLGEMADEWDIAAMPSYNGEVTAKLHADTFRILNYGQSEEQQMAAFEVLTYLIGEASPDLLLVYGGMPARPAETDAFFATLDETYPHGVDWQVALDSLNYPDNPSHEANMPNFNKADERIGAFYSLLQSDGTIDVNAELDKLVTELQAIYDEQQ